MTRLEVANNTPDYGIGVSASTEEAYFLGDWRPNTGQVFPRDGQLVQVRRDKIEGTSQRWVNRLHRRYQASCSFGGWFEDRSTLWNGHYMQPGQTFHLGVDFCVPERSRIYSPAEGTVFQTWHDEDKVGGWGGRIVVEVKPRFFLILAHLGKIHLIEGQKLRVGQLLGTVGGASNNGNWFPHLHAQLVRGKFENSIDGYGEFSVKNQRRFPHPFTLWPAIMR